jgi:hypothetical protein
MKIQFLFVLLFFGCIAVGKAQLNTTELDALLEKSKKKFRQRCCCIDI